MTLMMMGLLLMMLMLKVLMLDSNQCPAQYIKVPLQLGQINIEDILKFPGVQVQLLGYEKMPKQN